MSDYFLWLLFSFHGRINRATFAIFLFTNLVVNSLFNFFVIHRLIAFAPNAGRLVPVYNAPPLPVLLVVFLLSLALIWVSLANHVKRLHDFGWSGWWLAAPAGAFLLGWLLTWPFLLVHQAAVGAILFGLTALVTVLGAVVLLCMQFFRRGDAGENGHPRGPSGSAPRSLEPIPVPAAPRADLASYHPGRQAPQTFGRRGVRA